MTFLELAKSRYSVRSFKDQPIEDEIMRQILEAGHVAPTACNNQPQKIYIAKSEEARKNWQLCAAAPLMLLLSWWSAMTVP